MNIAATTVENYRKLKDAGIGTYILFQETYHKESYEKLHPTGPKHDYCYHTEAMDRAQQGGIDDVGCGVLFGLELYRYEFAGLLMHAEHLEAVFGVGPIPSACPGYAGRMTLIRIPLTMELTTTPLPSWWPVSASQFPTQA